MDNYNRFLNKYNTINKHLISKYNLQEKTTFGEAVYVTRKHDPIVSYYFEDLKSFGELRNVLVHETIYKQENVTLATPTDEVVKRIEHISNRLEHPQTVGELFNKDVISFKIHDPLTLLLKTIKEKRYSKFPVFDEQKFVGVITENGIANWLAEHVDDNILSLNKITLLDIITVEENKDDYKIILDSTSVFSAEQLLVNHLYHNRGLALIISNKEKPSKPEDLLGIITAFDLPRLREAL